MPTAESEVDLDCQVQDDQLDGDMLPRPMGTSISSRVPCPGGLSTKIVPPSASTRSVSPTSPEPPSVVAPPSPSSRIDSWRRSLCA